MEINLMTMLMQVATGPEVVALVALMLANVVLSICAAISKKTFSFRNLGDFVGTRVTPLIAYFVIAVLMQVVPSWAPAAVAIYVGLVALYGSGILAALNSLGLKVPTIFTEKK